MSSSPQADDQSLAAIVKLLVFSVALVVLPLSLFNASEQGSFDGLYHILFPHLTSNQHLLLSGAVAVLGVNFIVIVYIVLAFLEPSPSRDVVIENPLLAAEEDTSPQHD